MVLLSLSEPSSGKHAATAVRCDCHGNEMLAIASADAGVVEVRDRRHGTTHAARMGLDAIVRMLDPGGTTYVRRQ